MSYACPKGHTSSEPDFCSECGAKIAGAPTTEPVPSRAPACPDCEAPRLAPDSVFCEVCGFNFVTGAHGEIAMAAPVSSAPPDLDSAPALAPVAGAAKSWSLEVSVDPQAREAGSPEPPSGVGPFTFDIAKPVSLIGRHSAARAIDPEIALDFDDAVSHRHAILTRTEEGALVLRDIGSSNGTELNGATVSPMTDHPLQDGDQLTLGHWTRVKVHSA